MPVNNTRLRGLVLQQNIKVVSRYKAQAWHLIGSNEAEYLGRPAIYLYRSTHDSKRRLTTRCGLSGRLRKQRTERKGGYTGCYASEKTATFHGIRSFHR